MSDLLHNSKKILCATKQNASTDLIVSSYVLASNIQKVLGKSVEIGTSTPADFQEYAKSDGIKTISKLLPLKYIISIDEQQKPIKDVQWDQSEDKLQLYITTDNMDLDAENIKYSISGANHDLTIVIGCSTLEDLGPLFTDSSNFFERSNIINLNNDIGTNGFGNEKFIAEDTSSVSEATLKFLEANEIEIDARSASLLLAGILDATKKFRNGVKSAETFETCAKLVKLGGDVAWAASKVSETTGATTITSNTYNHRDSQGTEISTQPK